MKRIYLLLLSVLIVMGATAQGQHDNNLIETKVLHMDGDLELVSVLQPVVRKSARKVASPAGTPVAYKVFDYVEGDSTGLLLRENLINGKVVFGDNNKVYIGGVFSDEYLEGTINGTDITIADGQKHGTLYARIISSVGKNPATYANEYTFSNGDGHLSYDSATGFFSGDLVIGLTTSATATEPVLVKELTGLIPQSYVDKNVRSATLSFSNKNDQTQTADVKVLMLTADDVYVQGLFNDRYSSNVWVEVYKDGTDYVVDSRQSLGYFGVGQDNAGNVYGNYAFTYGFDSGSLSNTKLYAMTMTETDAAYELKAKTADEYVYSFIIVNGGLNIFSRYKNLNLTINKVTDGIEAVMGKAHDGADAEYNIMGQRVSSTTKGIIIRNGRKMVRR